MTNKDSGLKMDILRKFILNLKMLKKCSIMLEEWRKHKEISKFQKLLKKLMKVKNMKKNLKIY